jgi:hypothetical protein
MHNADKSAASTESSHDLITDGACAHRINKLRRYREGNICVKERTANLSEAGL